MPRAASTFRIGKVRGYRRNKVWYLCYHEQGKRLRPRIGPNVAAARQLAAQVTGPARRRCPLRAEFPTDRNP